MSDPLNSTETLEPVSHKASGNLSHSAANVAKKRPPQGTSARSQQPSTLPSTRKLTLEEDDDSFLVRNRVTLIIAGVFLLGGASFYLTKPSEKSAPPRKAPEVQTIRLVIPPAPPPPPPPPKVQPPPPKDEKKIEQTPVDKPAEKPVEKPAEKPPESLGTSIKGGQPLAGLSSGTGNGLIGGTGTGKGGGGGSMARWYAGKAGTRIADALRNHRKTRSASMRVEAQIWVDPSGRISRATLDRSTGDASLDEALTKEVLPGIQLSEPPPAGMRMPIPYRFTARRPN